MILNHGTVKRVSPVRFVMLAPGRAAAHAQHAPFKIAPDDADSHGAANVAVKFIRHGARHARQLRRVQPIMEKGSN